MVWHRAVVVMAGQTNKASFVRQLDSVELIRSDSILHESHMIAYRSVTGFAKEAKAQSK